MKGMNLLVGDGAQTWLAGSFQAAAEDGGWDSNDMDRLGGGRRGDVRDGYMWRGEW